MIDDPLASEPLTPYRGLDTVAAMNSDGGNTASAQELRVVPDEVRQVGRFVYGIAQNLRSALDSAGSEVDAVVSGSWRGSAADEFAVGWSETRDGGAQIFEALTAMAEKLGVTAENYRMVDESRASTTSSLDL